MGLPVGMTRAPVRAQQFRAMCQSVGVTILRLTPCKNEWVALVMHNYQYAVIAKSRYVYGENVGRSLLHALRIFSANERAMFGW